ncbi:unnamed protein product [Leuciscus chuanchicus]
MVESRCGRTAIEISAPRSHSSLSRGDWRCVFHSQRARYTTRSPVPKGRFYGRPNISQKEHSVCLSGSRRWCYKCRSCAHSTVFAPTYKHGRFSDSHSFTAHIHKLGSRRVCFECGRGARCTALIPSHKHGLLCDKHSFRAPVNKHKTCPVCKPPSTRHELCYVCAKRARLHERALSLRRCEICATHTHSDNSRRGFLPLAFHIKAWRELPGVSEWVLNTVERGYSLQFAHRPPRFRARVETTVNSEVAHLLRAEIAKLLEKRAVETVPHTLSESGFYSRYFLVPKKDGGLRHILDLRRLNKALMQRLFKMLTTSQILAQIHPRDWFISVDLKDAYFQIQIAPHHRPFLRFAFEGLSYQYTVLPFGLSLAPRTFTKCMDAALAPLRQRGMRILNYLDDWLILAQSESELIAHRALLLDHLRDLGLQINWTKSLLSPSQRISFLGTDLDSVSMTARLTSQRALQIQRSAAAFRTGSIFPLKRFQRMVGLMASASAVLQLGLLFMRPLQHWLKTRVPLRAWSAGRVRLRVTQNCVTALNPWKAADWYQSGVDLGMTSRRKVISTDASNSGWGALYEGRPVFGLWAASERRLHINCLEMTAVENALRYFLPLLKGHNVLVRTDNMSVVSYINRQGGLRSRSLHKLAERLLLWAHHNLRSLRASHVPGCQNVGPDMLSRDNVPPGEWSLHPQIAQLLWDIFGRADVDLFASTENAHCPVFFTKQRDALAHDWPSRPLYAFPPIAMLPQVIKHIRESKCSLLLVAPHWRNQVWFSELMQLTSTTPWPIPVRKDLLSQARGAIWHPRPDLWALHAWAINGFLREARRLNPPQPPLVPAWDLSLVLDSMKGEPFEPLQSVDLRYLSLKTAFLMALASVKRVGDLHALSTNFIQIRLIMNIERPITILVRDYINIFLGYVKGLFKEAYIGGVPTAVREKYNIVLPSLRGCVNNIQVDITSSFTEEVGIVQGCPNPLLGSREATLEFGSSLSVLPTNKETDSETMVSLGFKTSQENIPVLVQTGGTNNDILLSLKDGFVEMSDRKEKLTSRNKCEIGKWHYITAYRSSGGMQLNVDNTDIGGPPSSSTFDELEENFILGDGLFEGCLRNLYLRSPQSGYIPADLSRFNQTGTVSLGFCKAERPPLETIKKRSSVFKLPVLGSFEQGCRNTKSVKHTYHLGSNSQMQFKIDPEELNNWPHFSLDIRTTSSEGLLLHISGTNGVPLVILYLHDGKVKLYVGADKVISSQEISDGDWHSIKFRVKKHNFRLAVDGVKTPDGQQLKGFTHDLQSPVYVGHGHLQTLHKTYGEVPQKSIVGCIRDLRVSKVLFADPAVNHGVMPCFKGVTEKGAYFAGNGAHLVLEKYLISGSTYDLAFEIRPRNLTGLVFHKSDNHGRTLTLFLKRGKVVVKANDGEHRYGTALTPTRPLCGAIHHVAVSLRRKTIVLRVDEATSRVRLRSVSRRPTTEQETIYIGGVSENVREGVEMRTSYVGCLRNVRLNKNSVSFEDVSVFGPINTGECPAE